MIGPLCYNKALRYDNGDVGASEMTAPPPRRFGPIPINELNIATEDVFAREVTTQGSAEGRLLCCYSNKRLALPPTSPSVFHLRPQIVVQQSTGRLVPYGREHTMSPVLRRRMEMVSLSSIMERKKSSVTNGEKPSGPDSPNQIILHMTTSRARGSTWM